MDRNITRESRGRAGIVRRGPVSFPACGEWVRLAGVFGDGDVLAEREDSLPATCGRSALFGIVDHLRPRLMARPIHIASGIVVAKYATVAASMMRKVCIGQAAVRRVSNASKKSPGTATPRSAHSLAKAILLICGMPLTRHMCSVCGLRRKASQTVAVPASSINVLWGCLVLAMTQNVHATLMIRKRKSFIEINGD